MASGSLNIQSPKKKTTCGIAENIGKGYVFIDGITRSGKSILSSVVPSLKEMELMQFYILIELIVPALRLGKLDLDFAKSLLRIHMNELAYNLLISRYVNFRPEDHSGVHGYQNPQVYFERLKRKDGDEVVNELRAAKRFMPVQTHDLMVNLDQLEKLDIDYKMVHIFRNPIDNIHSWWKRGWGERFSSDPRSFTLTINYGNEILPWYSHGIENECLNLNPMEFCIKVAVHLIRQSVEQYQKAQNKNKIHILTFEDFAKETDREMTKICRFLGTSPSEQTPEFLKNARCPRELDLKDRIKKTQDFKQGTKPEIFDELMTLAQSYEKNLYGLR